MKDCALPHVHVSSTRQGGERTARHGTCTRRARVRPAGDDSKLVRGSVLVWPRQRRSTRVPAAKRHDSILWVADCLLFFVKSLTQEGRLLWSRQSPLFGPSGVRSLRRFIFRPRSLRRMPYLPSTRTCVKERPVGAAQSGGWADL